MAIEAPSFKADHTTMIASFFGSSNVTTTANTSVRNGIKISSAEDGDDSSDYDDEREVKALLSTQRNK